MRMLIWHVDSFSAEPTERGRSQVADAAPQPVRVEDGIVVFAACEKADEAEPEAVAGRAAGAIADVAQRLGAREIVLHSFAHLFVELSAPAAARDILNATQAQLETTGYTVGQSAFGWPNHPHSSYDAPTPVLGHRFRVNGTKKSVWACGSDCT